MLGTTRERFTAYVVFVGADHRRAWRIATRRGWRHCLVILPRVGVSETLVGGRGAIVLNPIVSHLCVHASERSPLALAHEALNEGATCVVRCRVDRSPAGEYVPRGLLTCVSVIKAVLGVRAWWVVTPEQLARVLLRMGGELVGSSDGVAVHEAEDPEAIGLDAACAAAAGQEYSGRDDGGAA